MIVRKNKIIVVEIAGRLSGGYFSSHMIPAANGIRLVDLAIKIALKEKLNKKISMKGILILFLKDISLEKKIKK